MVHIKPEHRKSSWTGKVIISHPAYAVLSQINSSHHLRARRGGSSRKMTWSQGGRGGGVWIPPKIDDVIYEQPLTLATLFIQLQMLKCFWLFPHFFFGQEEMNFNIWVFWLQYDDDHQALSGYIQEMWPQRLSQCQEQLCLHSHISKYGRPSISHTLLLFWGGTPISKSRAGLTYLKV